MVSQKFIFAVLLAVACMTAGGCKKLVRTEYTYVQHSQLMAEVPSDGEEQKALVALHTWLPAHGYTQLTSQADIDAATTWSGHGKPYNEIWRKAIDPAAPKSEFVISVMEDGKPKVLMINLTAERSGEEADHQRQIPMVQKESEEFYKTFDAFPWFKRWQSQ